MSNLLMSVAKLRNGRYVGAIRSNGTVTATTLLVTSRNAAARSGAALRSLMLKDTQTRSKPPVFARHEHQIGTHFLSALIDGDYSGLDSQECADLDSWLRGVSQGKTGHWDTSGETDEFGLCDVTGLHGQVSLVAYMELTTVA